MPGEESEPGAFELFVEPNDSGLIDNAENLTVAPWGDLVICEDGPSESSTSSGVMPEGEIYKCARNAYSDSELASATFSPDGTSREHPVRRMDARHHGRLAEIRRALT